VARGDALELAGRLPEHSISLILTDPPYHITKKHNIVGDRSFSTDEEFIAWMRGVSLEWLRVLRLNGSLYLFCATRMAARLEVSLSSHFNPLAHIAWSKPNDPGFDGWKGKMKKEALRAWYAHSERILFFEPACHGNLKRATFGTWLRKAREEAGLTAKDLAEITRSYGRVNHGGAVSNWETGRNVPSKDQYDRIVQAFSQRLPMKRYPAYEDVVRPFNVTADIPFIDVWDDPSVRPFKGKHPAEKPVGMLARMVHASSYPGDIVLDSFAGSGSSGVAALSTGRRAILIDVDGGWCEAAAARLKETVADSTPDGSKRRLCGRSQLGFGL
jgi:site-specific DNA-methyltransferase (adenine-specific)